MHRIDVHELADEAKFNGFPLARPVESTPIRCISLLVLDGYDLPVAGAAWQVMS